MANYYGMTRTNCFKVTDPERLKKIINNVYCCEDAMELHERRDENGDTSYVFCGYGTIEGLTHDWETSNNEDREFIDDADFDIFTDELQKIVAPNDAIIITEIGNEQLRYLTAFSTVITKEGVYYIDLGHASVEVAKKSLNNPKWKTKMEY